MTVRRWRVLGCKGCGSAIVEAALVLADIAYDREEVNYETKEGHDKLTEAGNALAQVPTVILPDGTVMTESAALILYIDGLVPSAGLVPHVKDPLRRDMLRWMMFLVAAVYPTFTYGDDPKKWVTEGIELRESTDSHRESLWRLVEGAVRGPWFLGDRSSALDVYVSVMTRWRPGRNWFYEHCPRLHEIAIKMEADPRLQQVWAANFE